MKLIHAVRELFTDTDQIDPCKMTDMEVSRRINEARLASLARKERFVEHDRAVSESIDNMLSDVSSQWQRNRTRDGLG